MATKIQVRRDTTVNWATLNATLASGEIGFETDTGKFKIGDGSSSWSALDYFGGEVLTTQTGFINLIINGDFRINQRTYISGSPLASNNYGFDRWKSTNNTSLFFTSAPQGQMVTIDSGGSIEQVIERANMPAGAYILSWTGTATGRVYNTGATPPSYAASPILVTLDGSANVEVEFTASGGAKTLQNVQFEQGSIKTPFEKRPIGTELILCQRYYQILKSPGISTYDNILAGFAISTNLSGHIWNLPVQMRAVPTSNISYNAVSVVAVSGGTVSDSITLSNNNDNSVNHVYINALSATSPWTANQPLYLSLKNSTSFIAVSAEL